MVVTNESRQSTGKASFEWGKHWSWIAELLNFLPLTRLVLEEGERVVWCRCET